jgi:serine/threonine protein kinase
MVFLYFRVCGTPSEENWRGVASLPLYEQMLPIKHYKRQLIETFNQHCEPAAVKLLDRLLVLDPERRPSSTEALKDLFFKETSSKNDSVYVAYILV